MDKYEQLSVVGEGSYGVVLKCRRRDNGQLVAIKKFLETEEDAGVRKMALREIRMLKKLRHDHLVNLIEVFRRKRRFYLVFEYLERTLLDQLEDSRGGLGEDISKRYLFQLLKGIEYCHQNSIIHRDVKPENVLVSACGVVKLCDLGFARTLAAPGEPYTEYVATRWYRAPELLVAEHRYGPEVDIWAIGCLFAEMLTGEPLFPGDSDIDQLALIVKTVGKLAPRHQQIVARLSGGAALPLASGPRASLPGVGHGRELIAACLRTEPRARPSATVLLRHKYFVTDGFAESFNAELRKVLGKPIDSGGPPKINTARVAVPLRHKYTLNNGHGESIRPRTNSNAESLIDYNFTNDMQTAASERKSVVPDADTHISSPEVVAGSKKSKEPTTAKSLVRAINRAFKSFPVPVNAYPRTPYIKKVNNRLVIDSDMLVGGSSSNKQNKITELTLPFVPGASNIVTKETNKSMGTKGLSDWEHVRRSSLVDSSPSGKTLTNLPFMPPP